MNYDKMYEEFQRTQVQMMESWEKWILGSSLASERKEKEATLLLWKEILFPDDFLEEDPTDQLADLWETYLENPEDSELSSAMENLWKQAVLNVEENQLINMVSGSLQALVQKIFSEIRLEDTSWDSWQEFSRTHQRVKGYGIKWKENYHRQTSLNLFPNTSSGKLYLELQREFVDLLLDYEEKVLSYLFTLGQFIQDQEATNWDLVVNEEDPSFEAFIENWSELVEDKLELFHQEGEVGELISEIQKISDGLVQTQTLLMENRTNYLPFVNKRSYDELKNRVEELEETMDHAVTSKDLESVFGEVDMVKKNLRKNAADTVFIEKKLQKFLPRDELESLINQRVNSEDLVNAQHILREDLALTQRALNQVEATLETIQGELNQLQETVRQLQNKDLGHER